MEKPRMDPYPYIINTDTDVTYNRLPGSVLELDLRFPPRAALQPQVVTLM
jgi:hypothetical protein